MGQLFLSAQAEQLPILNTESFTLPKKNKSRLQTDVFTLGMSDYLQV